MIQWRRRLRKRFIETTLILLWPTLSITGMGSIQTRVQTSMIPEERAGQSRRPVMGIARMLIREPLAIRRRVSSLELVRRLLLLATMLSVQRLPMEPARISFIIINQQFSLLTL